VGFYQSLAAELMIALLVKPDNEHRRCADYDQLVSVYLVSDPWRRFVFSHALTYHCCAHCNTDIAVLCVHHKQMAIMQCANLLHVTHTFAVWPVALRHLIWSYDKTDN